MEYIPCAFRRFAFLFLCYISLCNTAFADKEAGEAFEEMLQIIVTNAEIRIGTQFNGANLHIAGVLENADPFIRRQNRYDIIVTMTGPSQSVLIHKKARRMGIWLNVDSLEFSHVPFYYALASTRELRDITTPQLYQNLNIGVENLRFHPDSSDIEKVKLFTKELIRLKEEQNLYSQQIGTINFGSLSLFRVQLPLPVNSIAGTYTISAYLFRDNAYIHSAETQIEIRKEDFTYSLYEDAHKHSFLYGIAAVILAIIIGFLSRFLFQKD